SAAPDTGSGPGSGGRTPRRRAAWGRRPPPPEGPRSPSVPPASQCGCACSWLPLMVVALVDLGEVDRGRRGRIGWVGLLGASLLGGCGGPGDGSTLLHGQDGLEGLVADRV